MQSQGFLTSDPFDVLRSLSPYRRLNSIGNSHGKKIKSPYPKELNNNLFADRGIYIIGEKIKKEFRSFLVQVNF